MSVDVSDLALVTHTEVEAAKLQTEVLRQLGRPVHRRLMALAGAEPVPAFPAPGPATPSPTSPQPVRQPAVATSRSTEILRWGDNNFPVVPRGYGIFELRPGGGKIFQEVDRVMRLAPVEERRPKVGWIFITDAHGETVRVFEPLFRTAQTEAHEEDRGAKGMLSKLGQRRSRFRRVERRTNDTEAH